MSVVATLGNFKNIKDYETKRSQFFKTLNLQAELNKRYEDAMIQRSQLDKLGVQPITETPRGMEGEKRDDIGQQQIALRHLQSIMIPSQAMKALQELDMEKLRLLNTYWGKFATQVKGISNIDAEFFRRLFTNFLKFAEETEEFARPIPLRESTIARLPGDLLDAWNAYARKEIDPLTEKVMSIEALMRQTAEALSRSMADVKQEVSAEQSLPMTEKVMPSRMPRPKAPSSVGRPSEGRPSQKGDTAQSIAESVGLAGPDFTQVIPDEPDARKAYLAISKEGATSDLKLSQIRALLKPVGKTTRSIADGLKKLEDSYGGVKKEEESGMGMYMGRGRGMFVATPVQHISSMTPQLIYRGDGTLRLTGHTRTLMERGLKQNRVGSGILMDKPKKESKVQFRQLGRYMLNMDYLKNGLMYVKYQSLEKIPSMPPRLVSPDFQELMYRLFETGKVDKTLFSQLSETEQDYFEFVAKKCQIYDTIGMGKIRPKSVRPCQDPDEENDNEVRRFQLLRGMIAAGNNDKSVLKELKAYLYKFMDEGRMTKRIGDDILSTLAPAIKV